MNSIGRLKNISRKAREDAENTMQKEKSCNLTADSIDMINADVILITFYTSATLRPLRESFLY